MRVCSVAGCPNLYATTHSRCPTHRAIADKARGTATQRGYTSRAHRSFRNQVLTETPICSICEIRESTVADHWPLSRRELEERGMNPNDPKHGRGLCANCHNAETARHQPGGWNALE